MAAIVRGMQIPVVGRVVMASDNPRRGIVGSLEGLGFPEIVQALILGRKTARVTLTSEARWGHVWFTDGVLTHAVADRFHGELAVYELAKWVGGEFYIEHDVETHVRSIEQDSMYVLMEAARRVDEAREEPADADSDRELIPLVCPPEAEQEAGALVRSTRRVPGRTRSRRRFRTVSSVVGALAVFTALWAIYVPDDPAGKDVAGGVATLVFTGVSAGARLSAGEPGGAADERRHDEEPETGAPAAAEPEPRKTRTVTHKARSRETGVPTPSPEVKSGPESTAVEPPIPLLPGSIAPTTAAEEPQTPAAALRLHAKTNVREGRLTILVDGQEVLSKPIPFEERPKGFLERMQSTGDDTFEAVIPVEAGEHQIVARVDLTRKSMSYENRLTLESDAGTTSTLRLFVGRKGGRLKVE